MRRVAVVAVVVAAASSVFVFDVVVVLHVLKTLLCVDVCCVLKGRGFHEEEK